MSSSSRWAGAGTRRPGWKAVAGAVVIMTGVIVAVTPAFGMLSPRPQPSACGSATASPSSPGSPSATDSPSAVETSSSASLAGHAGAATAAPCQPAGRPSSGSLPDPRARGSRSLAARSCYFKQILEWIGSAYLGGWANAAKLKGSALLSPGGWDKPRSALQDLHGWYGISDSCNNFFYQYTTGTLDYGRHHVPQFPPGRTTFLSFGFEPTTATMQLTLVPIKCIDIAGHLVAPPPTYVCIVAASNQLTNAYTVTATSKVEIRISDVRVNGVKLDVGNNCRTATPMESALKAASDNQYDVLAGGILQGSSTIPRWTGCGAPQEKLDAIIDAALSGPGNFTILTQGPTCVHWINPPSGTNGNCRIPPGPGHPYGVPKFYPIPMR